MVKKATKRPRRVKPPKINQEEEKILLAATLHLITKHGMFLVATDVREFRVKGFPVWIIAVTLRYDKGVEGYVGDLLYDGEEFTFITDKGLMDERIRTVAESPECQRKWEEHKAAMSKSGKR